MLFTVVYFSPYVENKMKVLGFIVGVATAAAVAMGAMRYEWEQRKTRLEAHVRSIERETARLTALINEVDVEIQRRRNAKAGSQVAH